MLVFWIILGMVLYTLAWVGLLAFAISMFTSDLGWKGILAGIGASILLILGIVVPLTLFINSEPNTGSCQYFHYGPKATMVCDQYYPLPQRDH